MAAARKTRTAWSNVFLRVSLCGDGPSLRLKSRPKDVALKARLKDAALEACPKDAALGAFTSTSS